MKDGIILINKPEGITSFSAVAKMKRTLSVKCGHSGTLDPLATGLLPIMCGKATKLCQYLTEGDKFYRAELLFGIATDTFDVTGNVTKKCDKIVTLSEIENVISQFTGKIKQTPPIYSAIKVNGKALYKLAREGKSVLVPEREIEVYSIDLLEFRNNRLTMDVHCSKGTYIRSLCSDIAKAIGTVGTMSALTRTKCGRWSIEQAVSLDCEDLEKHIISMDEALSDFPVFNPGKFFAQLLSNGCEIDVVKLKNLPLQTCRVYNGEKLLGLGNIIIKNEKEYFKLITHL